MDNKILIVGVLDVPSSTNSFMRKGFTELGYTVDAYNYRTKAKELGSLQAMWGDFAKFIKSTQYELIVFCKVNELHPELINFANRYAKTWYWFMDNIEVARAIHADEYAKRACFASATSQESTELFKKSNPNTFQIIEGFDPATYYKEELPKKYDVTFIGNAYPKRIQDLREIMNGHRVAIFGKGWPSEFQAKEPVYNRDLREVICQSKIILNLVHSNIFSDRVVLTAACGGLVLSQTCEDLQRHFTESEVAIFTSIEDARDQIGELLKDEEARNLIAKCGMDVVNQNFTWKEVCRRIIGVPLARQSTKDMIEPAMTHDYRPNFLSYYVKQQHKSLLDVSCGKGAYLKYWKWKGLGVEGTEGDKELVKYNEDRGFPCTHVDLNNPDFRLPFIDKSFDVVTCTEVIEHVKNPKKVVRELIRVAKELVMITTPVGNSYASPDHINHWNNYVELGDALPSCDYTIHEIVTKPEDWPMKQRCFFVVINK